METQLKSLKDDFDMYLGSDNKFSQQDKVRIRHKYRNQEKKRRYLLPKISASLILLVLIAAVSIWTKDVINKDLTRADVAPGKKITITQEKDKEKEKEREKEKEKLAVQDKEIMIKVRELQGQFKPGMSSQELDQMFGNDYTLVKNPDIEDMTVGDRKYEFIERSHDSNVENYEFDIENLVERNLGIQFFIGVNQKGSAERAAIVYVQGKEVWMNFISKNENRTEKIN